MKITVAICSKDREQKLLRCIEALRHQAKDFDTLMVVEDTSNGQHFSIKRLRQILGKNSSVECQYFSVQFANIAKSRQLVLDMAPEGILIAIDDDVVVTPHTLSQVRQFFKKHLKVSFLTGRVLPMQKNNWVSVVDYVYFSQENLSYTQDHRIITSPFSFVAINFPLIQKLEQHLPGFDSRFHNGEDLDFSLRLHRKKHQLMFTPSLRVHHDYDTSPLAYLRKRFTHGKYIYLLYLKHGEVIWSKHTLPTLRKLLLSPLFLFRHAFYLTKRYISLYPFTIPQKVLIYFAEIATLLGMAKEILRIQLRDFLKEIGK